MKLISLHIENFGKLSNFDYKFNERLNEIYKENGWGKTTLAVFIKTMLYGFNSNKRNLSNERLKYAPWNKGVYGGNLVIGVNNKTYKIERTFDVAKNNKDSFKLINMNTFKESSDYSEFIGEEILGINEDSFNRSVYIPQKVLDMKFNQDIASSLANIIGGSDDIGDYEIAIEDLDKKIKVLNNRSSGLIKNTKNEIALLEEELYASNSKINASDQYKKVINRIDFELSELDKKTKTIDDSIKEYALISERNSKLELYQKYNQELNALKLQESNLVSCLNNFTTSEEEIRIYQSKLVAYKANLLKNKKESEKSALFDILESSNIDLIDLENKVNDYYYSSSKQGLSVFLLLGILLLVAGAIMAVTTLLIPGIISLVVGLVLLVLGFIKKPKNNNKDEIYLRKIFSRFNMFDLDYRISLNNLKQLYKDYEIYLVSQKEKVINDNLLNEIKSYLDKFKLKSSSIDDKLFELNKVILSLKDLSTTIEIKEKELNEFLIKNKINEIKEEKIIDIDFLRSSREMHEKQRIELNNQKQMQQKNLLSSEMEIQHYEEIKDLLENKKELLTKQEVELKVLTTTKDMLSKANENMLTKYLKPMRDALDGYFALLAKNKFSKYNISVDFELKINELGLDRELDYFSIGEQELISLCMRLALVDIMYQDELPFVILDDPFVNFDEEKLNKAKGLLVDISKKYQVIYLTCHKSRVI